MALRTFRSNPALGGFGGESSAPLVNRTGNAAIRVVDCDAFAQIIKELVDNAVDACSVDDDNDIPPQPQKKKKRVRVSIERFEPQQDGDVVNLSDNEGDDDETRNSTKKQRAARNQANVMGKQEILRITVLDNGCGMNDIQASVDAFRTSKAHAALPSRSESDDNEDPSTARGEGRTAGRYGIGLTLCLLHAQRLVPNSCATIKSATADAAHYDFVTCIVDTEGDLVRCIRRQQLPKSFAGESGTAVSVLVPGGATAMLAWPRLAEYFARFKLSLGLQCSLEVMAPTLSKVPLVVRPFDHYVRGTHKATTTAAAAAAASRKQRVGPVERPWVEGLEYDDEDEEKDETESQPSRQESNKSDDDDPVNDDERSRIWKATQLYLGHPLRLMNVAHALVPIRVEGYHPSDASCPKLEVDVIVHGEDGEGTSVDLDADGDDDDDSSATQMAGSGGNGSAGMLLVRMVNRIPLLDGAEAVACGLVQGLAAKKRVWNSFGLEVTLHYDSNNITKLPTFQVRDSDQVAPFFQKGAHVLYEGEDEEELDEKGEGDDSSTEDGRDTGGESKRKRNSMRRVLLPAKVRLGNIVVIVQIHAEPTTLPLPTLSKGRLPVDNTAIDTALEVGLVECLRKLQKSNPGLLLTAAELRKAERDARYVPAVSSALATILCKSQNKDQTLIRSIQDWSGAEPVEATEEEEAIDDRPHREQIEKLGTLIEGRLRLVLSHGGKRKTTDNEAGSVAENREDGSQEQRWEVEMDDILEQSSTDSEKSNPESSQDTTSGLTEL